MDTLNQSNINTVADNAAREIIDSISVNDFRDMQRLGRTSKISDIIYRHLQEIMPKVQDREVMGK